MALIHRMFNSSLKVASATLPGLKLFATGLLEREFFITQAVEE
jgi:hypothetical protein